MKIERLGDFTYTQGDFPLGQDTLHLAAFATVKPSQRVCDLCCGGGALPLLLLGRAGDLKVTGIELDPTQGALATRNLKDNGLVGDILVGDFATVAKTLSAGTFDLVISNPPWFPVGTGASGGTARMEHHLTLAELCAAAGRLVKNGGRFALVHRPERLADILEAMRANGMEPKRLQFIQHNREKAPSALLVEGVRQGRAGLAVLPTLILH